WLVGVLVSLFVGITPGGLLLVHAHIYTPAPPVVITVAVVATAATLLRERHKELTSRVENRAKCRQARRTNDTLSNSRDVNRSDFHVFRRFLDHRLNVHFGWPHAFDLDRRNKMTTFQKLTVLMSMLCLLAAIPAMGQVDNRLTFQAPFAFYAGNAKLPAGSYTVTQPDDNSELLLIESADGLHSVFVDYMTDDSDTAPVKTEVTFNKY